MKLSVIAVGRVRPPLDRAVAEYEARAGRYWKLETIEVAAGSSGGGKDVGRAWKDEEERIRARIPEGSRLWVLTREGRGLTSVGLARALGDAALGSVPGITFVIGGAWGLATGLLADAERRLSLSSMTLPHEVARLVLAEQLYRAGTILKNEPYHKGGGRKG